jgi:hypothetical protein
MLIPVAIALVLPFQAEASSNGRNQGATSTCGGCHGSTASSSVTATITGPATLAPGATGTYTTLLTGTQLAGAGFNVNLTGTAGASLGLLDANTKFKAGSSAPSPYTTANQITHTDASVDNLGDWSYSFTLTAPTTPGTIDIRSVMLAYDNSGDTAGDLWNYTTFSVAVSAVPEPTTMLQLGAGLASLAFVGFRRSSKKNS